MEGGMRSLSNEFVRSKAQHAAGGRVHKRDLPFGVHAEDPFGARFEDETRTFFGDLELFALPSELSFLGEWLDRGYATFSQTNRGLRR